MQIINIAETKKGNEIMTVYKVEKSAETSADNPAGENIEKSVKAANMKAAGTSVSVTPSEEYQAEAQGKSEEGIIGKCRCEREKHGVVNRAGYAVAERRKNVRSSEVYDRAACAVAERRYIIFGALIITAGFAAGSVSWLRNSATAKITVSGDFAAAISDTVKATLPYAILFAANAYSAFGFMLNEFTLFFFAMGLGFKTCSLWNTPCCGSAGMRAVLAACITASTLVMLLLAGRSSAVSGRIFVGEIKRGWILRALIFAALGTAIYIMVRNFSVGGFRM